MAILVDIQRAWTLQETPGAASIESWVNAALGNRTGPFELNIRIVDQLESAELNLHYRGKEGPTNVLSFPFDAVTPEPLPILGDLVICAPILVREAVEQQKTTTAHWAHIVIHGVLHLLGYDHIEDQDAEQMESLETEIMLVLDFPPPYRILHESSDDPIEVTSS